jgi:HAE1 family hydrophobic/amphiphilic exporter-1
VFGNIFLALGVAAMLMYLILVMQFGSFIDPIAIMISLPLSLIGVMLGLAVTGLTINIMSLIGVILLMGIVAKNAILLIDFAKWARERQGLALREALIEAGAIRLRPILMTTFALIAGMIPVALGRGEGAQFRQPLGSRWWRSRRFTKSWTACGSGSGTSRAGFSATRRSTRWRTPSQASTM